MNRRNPKRTIFVVFVFVCIALFINSGKFRRDQENAQRTANQITQEEQQQAKLLQELQHEKEQKVKELAAQQAAQAAAAAHARFVATYVDKNFIRKPGTKTIALAVASENSTRNDSVSTALATRFKDEPVQLVSTFFKPAFITDGLFNDAFDGSADLFNKLELPKTLDELLLARVKVQYSSNPSLQNVITASMELDVVTLPIGSKLQSQTWTFTAAGAGFTRADARQQAEERLIKQIANDTKMVLN